MWKDKKAVIFDLDGTLVDSMWMWYDIDVEYLARFGITIPEGLQAAIEGMSFSETAVYFKERFQIPDSLEKMKNDIIDELVTKFSALTDDEMKTLYESVLNVSTILKKVLD